MITHHLNFHLSLPCNDLEETIAFYCDQLACPQGRSAHHWTDIDLHGNQITFIQTGAFRFPNKHYGFQKSVLPVFHFGVLLDSFTWNNLRTAHSEKGIISIEPIDFLSESTGEHRSYFVEDPNGYLIEFKSFSKQGEMFKPF